MSSPPNDKDRNSNTDDVVQHMKKMLDRLFDRLRAGNPDQQSVAETAVERNAEEDGA